METRVGVIPTEQALIGSRLDGFGKRLMRTRRPKLWPRFDNERIPSTPEAHGLAKSELAHMERMVFAELCQRNASKKQNSVEKVWIRSVRSC